MRYLSLEWWRVLATLCNERMSHRCPRVKGFAPCSGPALYEYVTSREGQAIILRCTSCGELAHILVCSGSGYPFISTERGQAVDDVSRVLAAVEAMATTGRTVDPSHERRHGNSRGSRRVPTGRRRLTGAILPGAPRPGKRESEGLGGAI